MSRYHVLTFDKELEKQLKLNSVVGSAENRSLMFVRIAEEFMSKKVTFMSTVTIPHTVQELIASLSQFPKEQTVSFAPFHLHRINEDGKNVHFEMQETEGVHFKMEENLDG